MGDFADRGPPANHAPASDNMDKSTGGSHAACGMHPRRFRAFSAVELAGVCGVDCTKGHLFLACASWIGLGVVNYKLRTRTMYCNLLLSTALSCLLLVVLVSLQQDLVALLQ